MGYFYVQRNAMSNPGISEELLSETATLYRQHGSIAGAARASGVPESTMKHRVHKAVAAGLLGLKPVPPEVVLLRNVKVVSLSPLAAPVVTRPVFGAGTDMSTIAPAGLPL